jgi:hypothetical protein
VLQGGLVFRDQPEYTYRHRNDGTAALSQQPIRHTYYLYVREYGYKYHQEINMYSVLRSAYGTSTGTIEVVHNLVLPLIYGTGSTDTIIPHCQLRYYNPIRKSPFTNEYIYI